DRLVGMITDRDIAMRAVAEKRAPDTSVGDVMTRDVHYCFEEDDIETASEKMSALQVRRLPVLNRDTRLVGVISLGDIARSGDPENTGETLGAISTPAIQSH
ncbi:MAG: CBS domain-containing protein, partial [Caulobacterales bacterium]